MFHTAPERQKDACVNGGLQGALVGGPRYDKGRILPTLPWKSHTMAVQLPFCVSWDLMWSRTPAGLTVQTQTTNDAATVGTDWDDAGTGGGRGQMDRRRKENAEREPSAQETSA